jgi:hypothetical protein
MYAYIRTRLVSGGGSHHPLCADDLQRFGYATSIRPINLRGDSMGRPIRFR